MRPDGLGRRLLQALSAKAAEGVEVCFLIDSVGGASMTPAIIREWRARGVRIIAFSASSSWRDTHVRVEGPSGLQLQMVFVADWYFTTGELLNAGVVDHDGDVRRACFKPRRARSGGRTSGR